MFIGCPPLWIQKTKKCFRAYGGTHLSSFGNSSIYPSCYIYRIPGETDSNWFKKSLLREGSCGVKVLFPSLNLKHFTALLDIASNWKIKMKNGFAIMINYCLESLWFMTNVTINYKNQLFKMSLNTVYYCIGKFINLIILIG